IWFSRPTRFSSTLRKPLISMTSALIFRLPKVSPSSIRTQASWMLIAWSIRSLGNIFLAITFLLLGVFEFSRVVPGIGRVCLRRGGLSTHKLENSTNLIPFWTEASERSHHAGQPTPPAAELTYEAAEVTYGTAEVTYGAAEATYEAAELTFEAAEATYGAAELNYEAGELNMSYPRTSGMSCWGSWMRPSKRLAASGSLYATQAGPRKSGRFSASSNSRISRRSSSMRKRWLNSICRATL